MNWGKFSDIGIMNVSATKLIMKCAKCVSLNKVKPALLTARRVFLINVNALRCIKMFSSFHFVTKFFHSKHVCRAHK